jgi:signal transduction histidine kinase
VPREILKRGMFYWLRAPRKYSDIRLDEWILVTGRLLLSICYLGALIRTDSIGISNSAGILLLLYLTFSLLVLFILRFRTHLSPASHFVIHLIDVLVATQLILLIPWPSMSLALFLFVMASTAIRWGFWEALLTLAAFCIFLLIGFYTHSSILLHQLRSKSPSELFPEALLYLAITCFIGLLAEAKAERSEGYFLAGIAAGIRIEPGLQHALYSVCSEELHLFGANQVLVVTHERDTNQFSLFRVARSQEGLQSLDLDVSQQTQYLFPAPATAMRVVRSGQSRQPQYRSCTLASGEMKRSSENFRLPDDFQANHPFQSLLSFAMEFEDVGSLRVYVMDPKAWFGGAAGMRFLEQSIRQIAPPICDLFLMRRLTAKAKAVAGSQMARELHDGVIQSLFNLNMQIEDMRRQDNAFSTGSVDFLARIQQRIQKEITSLRDFMQQLRSLEIDSDSLLTYLAGLSVKFQCENGIVTRFVSEVDEVQLKPRVCVQLARIVQEALVNVRKHSGARDAIIRLSRRNEKWVLSIIDDGVGFGFSGCRSHEELQSSGKGPLIIMERARAINAKVSIESVEGKGTCLEIVFPCEANARSL